jgi:prepilin-type N-terminal cleavage/methylation domain-containing protein
MKKMTRQRRRRAFTLLELIFCIVILTIVAGALSFPLKGMLDRHRFLHDVKRVAKEIREVQSLALNYQSDMGIELYKENDHFYCIGFTDEPIQPSPFKALHLEGLSDLIFNGAKISEHNPVQLKVFSSGRIEPKGKLFFTKEGEDSFTIELDTVIQLKKETKR